MSTTSPYDKNRQPNGRRLMIQFGIRVFLSPISHAAHRHRILSCLHRCCVASTEGLAAGAIESLAMHRALPDPSCDRYRTVSGSIKGAWLCAPACVAHTNMSAWSQSEHLPKLHKSISAFYLYLSHCIYVSMLCVDPT